MLHNTLRSYQGGADRPSAPVDDIQPPQNDQGKQGLDESKTIKRLTQRLFQQPWGTGSAGGQNLRRLGGEEAVIIFNQSF